MNVIGLAIEYSMLPVFPDVFTACGHSAVVSAGEAPLKKLRAEGNGSLRPHWYNKPNISTFSGSVVVAPRFRSIITPWPLVR